MHPLRELSLDQLRRRTSLKWREYDDDILPLWVAEMDVSLAAPVISALHEAIAEGDTGYPHGNGYADAFAGFATGRWGWQGVDPTRTALVADVMTGVAETIALVSEPGDPVVVSPPVSPPFFGFVEHVGREIVEAPLGADGRLDLEGLEAAFVQAGSAGRAVTYLLCNPHNPTATVHTLDELTGVAALARTYGVRVVADEIHAPLAVGFVPYLSVEGTANAFSMVSASKAWNLAGAKAALMVAGVDAAGDLERLLATHLPGAVWRPGSGTFLAWLDCRDLGLGDDPAEAFLREGRVAVNSGLPFGTGGAGHVRLNYATSPEILIEAVERMGRVVA